MLCPLPLAPVARVMGMRFRVRGWFRVWVRVRVRVRVRA